jgi:hypothetical protein
LPRFAGEWGERDQETIVQLTGNIPRLLTETAEVPRVIDVGRAHRPLKIATHTLDALAYAERGPVLLADVLERFSAANWLQFDTCDRPWRAAEMPSAVADPRRADA